MRRFLTKRNLVVALFVVLVAAVLALGSVVLFGTGSGGKSDSQTAKQSGPGTVFLYAVKAGDPHIVTYSPVQGTVTAIGRTLSKVPTTDADTQNGQPASCMFLSDDIKPTAAQVNELPFLSWTDLEGQDQQQFFKDDQGTYVVYVCNHYLKRTAGDDTVLVSLPQ